MLLSMIAIAERPPAERAAWKAFFEHSADQHGVLGPLQPTNYRRIRALVMRLLRGA
jgi:hypothetical protein